MRTAISDHIVSRSLAESGTGESAADPLEHLEEQFTLEATPGNADQNVPARPPKGILIAVVLLLAVLLAAAILIFRKIRRGKAAEREEEDLEEEFSQEICEEEITVKPEPPRHGIHIGKVHDIGKRGSQQDSFGISELNGQEKKKGVLAIVADGMGGLSNGGEISAMVTLSMMQYFDSHAMSRSPEMELLQMLGEANQKVNARLGKQGRGKSGSTVIAALIQEMNLYWISVGDSHIYLYRDSTLMQINRDHVYGAVLDERAARGEISFSEAASHPQRRALTSFIGIGELEQIDRNIRPMKLKAGDRVILASDGVFGTLSDEEIILAMQAPAEESGVVLNQMIRDKNRSAQDNYTAVILEFV